MKNEKYSSRETISQSNTYKKLVIIFNSLLGASLPLFIFIFIIIAMMFEAPQYSHNDQVNNLIITLEFYPIITIIVLITSLILMKFQKYIAALYLFIFPVLEILLCIFMGVIVWRSGGGM